MFDPLVDEADVLQVNPRYAHIRYFDGREAVVSTRNLAPQGQAMRAQLPDDETESTTCVPDRSNQEHLTKVAELEPINSKDQSPLPLRRSVRERCHVDRLGF